MIKEVSPLSNPPFPQYLSSALHDDRSGYLHLPQHGPPTRGEWRSVSAGLGWSWSCGSAGWTLLFWTQHRSTCEMFYFVGSPPNVTIISFVTFNLMFGLNGSYVEPYSLLGFRGRAGILTESIWQSASKPLSSHLSLRQVPSYNHNNDTHLLHIPDEVFYWLLLRGSTLPVCT